MAGLWFPPVDDATPDKARWRATVEEVSRTHRRELSEIREEIEATEGRITRRIDAVEARVRDDIRDLRHDLRSYDACIGLVEQALDKLARAVALLARPTPGMLALAAMLLIATLAWIGWSAVDVIQVAQWARGDSP